MLSKKRRRGARFGLAAYAYSCMPAPSGGAETLEYGIVGINGGIIPIEIAPFGSMKECGIGRWLEPVKVQTDA